MTAANSVAPNAAVKHDLSFN